MAEASIPVDLFNPGQVFACIGFAEAADVLLGNAEGYFDWSEPGDVRFHVRADGVESPVERALGFLSQAEAQPLIPAGYNGLDGWKKMWGSHPKVLGIDTGYPFPAPPTPATFSCCLSDGKSEVIIDYWGDVFRVTRRDNVKFWGGSGGKSGTALASEALDLARKNITQFLRDPYSLAAPQSSSFRLDWRRDYVPIDMGFSVNNHNGKVEMIGFPLVEILAAIGLRNARPKRPIRNNKLDYRYGVVGFSGQGERCWLPLAILRAALGGSALPFSAKKFRMSLGEPGQEGQDRAITMVTEESHA